MILVYLLIVIVLGIGLNGIFGAKKYSGAHGQSRPMASGGEFIAIVVILAVCFLIASNFIN